MGQDVAISTLGADDLNTMLDWAAAEGWNPGLYDAEAFLAADPNGFLGLFVDRELAVTISVVHYDATFAFAGFYICRPGHRGEGLGLELFHRALVHRDARTVGLDGVLEQEPNYARDGFVTAHHSVRYGGQPARLGESNGVRALSVGDVDALVAFERDHHLFPAPRPAFVERWITAPGSTACAAGDNDRIDGYGVIRACRDGHKVGPLFGTDRAMVERLLAALFAHLDGGPVFLDVPVPNTEACALARRLGPDGLVDVGPGRQHIGDRTTGCIRWRSRLERRRDALRLALAAADGAADLGRPTGRVATGEHPDLPHARLAFPQRGHHRRPYHE